MYEHHFGLKDKPFRVVPSPRFLYASETHDESRARILYGIRESRGFVVVTGAVGLGKTTVLLSVLDELDDRVRTALVFNPVESFAQLLRLVCLEFGIDTDEHDEVELLWKLNLFLVDAMSRHETCVLMIDEAQNLSLEMLEKVRTLSNLHTETASLLQVVLVGQPELMAKLDDPRLQQLRQRVGVWHEIAPLSRDDAESYIHHRLRLAGCGTPDRLFPSSSCHRVHHWTGGVPRLINQVCDTSLVIAFGGNESSVSQERIDEAAKELRLVEERAPEKKSRPPRVAAPAGAVAPRPIESARVAHRPHRSRAGLRWVVAGLVLVALVWLGGQIFGLWRGPLAAVGPALGSATLVDESPPMTEPDPRLPGVGNGLASANDSMVTTTSDVIASTLPDDRLLDRLEELQRWRIAGRPVYSAHLASFRERSHVDDFARELAAAPGGFHDLVFVEQTASGWYRVMGGAFASRDDALAWIVRFRRDRGEAYAQLERLDRDARPVGIEPQALPTSVVQGSAGQESSDE